MWLCIDLYLTLKQPFYPASRRLKFYLAASVLFSATIVASYGIYGSYNGGVLNLCALDSNSNASTWYNSILAVVLSFYIIIALFSIVYTGRMLSKPGISNNIKRLFLKKHILYVVGFISIWIVTLSSAYRNLYKANAPVDEIDEHDSLLRSSGYKKVYSLLPNGVYGEIWYNEEEGITFMETSQIVSLIATISTGVVMAFIRCFEPYFIFICRKTFFMIYGIPWTIDDEQEKYGKLDDTISTFLNSSLNIELVHIILKSITDDWKNQERVDLPWEQVYERFEHYWIKEKNDYYEIEIEDPDAWAIDKFENKTRDSSGPKKITRITEDIEVTQLAPDIFNWIRRQDDVTNDDIIKSLNPNDNREMAFKAGEGSGKSGSFFFFSHDRNFIIKTMTNGEYETFVKWFKSYLLHLMKNKDSLFARIFGIFSVKIEKLEPVHLIMMHNTIQSKFLLSYYIDPMWKEIKLKYLFDLKGSLINRETKLNMRKHKPGMTLKDINLLTIRKEENLLKFSPQDREKINDILEKDALVLRKHNIMDYSLLLAVEKSQIVHISDRNRTNTDSSVKSSPASESTPKLKSKSSLNFNVMVWFF